MTATRHWLCCIVRRGDVRHDQFREEEADADFAAARHHHPVAAAGYLGEMWSRRRNFTKAVDAYAQLIRCRPQDLQGYVGRGMAHESLGDLEEAAADYSEAIRLDPAAGVTYARLAHGSATGKAGPMTQWLTCPSTCDCTQVTRGLFSFDRRRTRNGRPGRKRSMT